MCPGIQARVTEELLEWRDRIDRRVGSARGWRNRGLGENGVRIRIRLGGGICWEESDKASSEYGGGVS